ncbi:IS110 family transposase [Neisseria lisongii]|uniref:IS110 family transposase n=1 Tax=Neisseria lisongii TaxID=2912188 RepID=UPI003FCE7C86
MQDRFMMSTQNYGGIDIAKRNFVIGITSSKKTKTETNNQKGFLHTIEYLKKHQVSLVVMESTGGLEIPLAKALHRAGFKVIIANPRQTHQFAQSQSLTKTDAADAKMLAFYAQVITQKPDWERQLYTPPSEAEEILEALISRRTQLVEMRSAEKNRLQQVHETQIQSVEALIAHFDALIAALDRQIEEHNDTHFGDKSSLLQSIKGIGPTTAATLCAMLPELGRVSHKQIAGLVGVAPYVKESGTMKFKSRCFGGRSAVRKTLYMAAMVAAHYEPRIKDFYQRLRLRGKPYKVAVTACMRKLLTILNAMMRDRLAEVSAV